MVHQSVFELVHSEDREELQRQLHWNSFLTPDQATMPLQVGIISIILNILSIVITTNNKNIISMISLTSSQSIFFRRFSYRRTRTY